MSTKFSSVFFEPWVGKDYGGTNSIFKQKVLILGDSHYCGTCDSCGERSAHLECTGFTIQIVRDYLNPERKPKWKKTYTTFLNSVFGKSTSIDERERFFDSVAFYNFLQVSAGEDPQSANAYDYNEQRHHDAFFEMLSYVLPDTIVVWGDRVWNVLYNDWGFGKPKEGKKIAARNTIFSQYQIYPYQGKEIMLIGVHHPCSGFPSEITHEVLSQLGVVPVKQ